MSFKKGSIISVPWNNETNKTSRHCGCVAEYSSDGSCGSPLEISNNLIRLEVGQQLMQLVEDALIQCSCFPGHESVRHRKRVICVPDEDRKQLTK